jgi:uncharacterized protein DUF3363
VAEEGVYRPSRHLEQARFDGRVAGGDHDGFIDAHVRRLEALRRAGTCSIYIQGRYSECEFTTEHGCQKLSEVRNGPPKIALRRWYALPQEGWGWDQLRCAGKVPKSSPAAAAGFGRQRGPISAHGLSTERDGVVPPYRRNRRARRLGGTPSGVAFPTKNLGGGRSNRTGRAISSAII